MVDVVNNYVPGYQQNLDHVAPSLMGSVNYLVSQGYDQNGNHGAPFFLGPGASDIHVNPNLTANPADIGGNATPTPAGSSATNEDGSIAAQVGELPNSQTATMLVPARGWPAGASVAAWAGATTTTGTEADAVYNQLGTGIGQATSAVNNQVTAHDASAKFISTVGTLLQSLLSMVHG